MKYVFFKGSRQIVHAQSLWLFTLLMAVLVTTVLIAVPFAIAAGTVTNCADYSGAGGLEEALTTGGKITFACEGNIIVAPEISISTNTVIDATDRNVTLSGGNINRVIRVESFATLDLINIKISNGFHSTWGGGIYILEGSTVTLSNSTVSGNKADWGGGIFNRGTVTLTNSTVSGNEASELGGGIYNAFNTLNLTNSTVSGNTGDGIANRSGATATLTNSTVFGNTQNGDGGGIYNDYDGTVTLINTTVSGNEGNGWGGGVMNFATVIFSNSTVYGNKAGGSGGGIANVYSGTVTMTNSIIADNTEVNINAGDCVGTITSNGHNLDSDGTCNLTKPNDLPSTDPLLGEFTDDGSPGRGHLPLLEDSPAIDNGDDAACLPTDQLENFRVDGDGDGVIVCDIGAIEFLPAYIEVQIDIKPGSYPNSINLKSKGKVPVAILTTGDFDAYYVDPVSCEFAGAYPIRWHIKDVNQDGDHDILFHFMTQELELNKDSTEATIECETFEGTQIVGTDSVNIVPKNMTGTKKFKN